jgi:copper chaperone NosL
MSRVTEFFQGEISGPGRLALALVALALVPAIFLPVWEITLEAPQYPQGLTMQIYAHELKGDIGEINILNHYIGMHEIRADEFREFIFIPFFILRFAGFAVLAMLVARMPIAAIGYLDYAIFGAVMLYDFQNWLTNYGTDLDPAAPLSMEPFSPSILGTTEIGQFAVRAMPGTGGWLMLAAGALGPVVLAWEFWRGRRAARG